MTNLFRFNILRPVQELPEERLNKIGINTHMDNASAWSQDLFDLCEQNDHLAIYNMAVTFLKSPNSVSSYNKVSPELQFAVDYFRRKGRNLDAADFNLVFDSAWLGTYFTPVDPMDPSTAPYILDKQAIEDTMLALAFLSKLGNKDNINHTLIFKVNQILAFAKFRSGRFTQADLLTAYQKPVALPYCRYNKCTKKYEIIEPFNYLNLELLEEEEEGEPDPQDPKQRAEATADCNCDCGQIGCQSQNKCCAELKPFITDLMLVREELKRYEAKHLAYIENIMVGEERTRTHRNLERTETLTETETETTNSLEKDHQVEDRFSLKSEIQKTLQEDIAIDAGVSVTTEFGTTKLDANFNFSYDLSKTESQQISQEYARNVLTRSVSKVEEKVRELKSVKRTTETEETNLHKFFNEGPKHIVGQYHFVNMINKAQVMNYGKRMMFEFVLPEPMELYKELLKKDVLPFGLTEPNKPPLRVDQVHPGPIIHFDDPEIDPIPTTVYSDNLDTDPLVVAELGLYDDMGLFNYLDLIKFYGLNGVDPLPDSDIYIPFVFENKMIVQGKNQVATFPVSLCTVPSGYKATKILVDLKGYDYVDDDPNPTQQMELEWFIDGLHSGPIPIDGGAGIIYRPNQPPAQYDIDATEGSSLSLMFMVKSNAGIAGSGWVKCNVTAQAKTKWQTGVWEKIMAKYNQEKEEFETARARYDQEKKAKLPFGNNPFINREIERTELKRLAISYISCQFYEQFSAIKRNTEPCGYPEMDLEQAQRDGSFIKFFEQTFEWNLMTYLFYPYFWGEKCSWPEKVQTNSGDPLFDKALAAGAARVQVPVRPGHEALAAYWSAYGEIWMGQSEPPVPGTPYYLSMVQELKEQKKHFYTDREGLLEGTISSNVVTLSDTNFYWDPTPVPPAYPGDPGFPNGQLNVDAIAADIDREILINCRVYRVTKIEEDTSGIDHMKWTITLDRNVEGSDCDSCDEITGTFTGVRFQMGALFVGSPFEVVVPTNLVFLRNAADAPAPADCLPCYPLDKCSD